MAQNTRYDAFISYRHTQPDSEIASALQKKLENFRLPKSVAQKFGKARLGRVFRDESELAVSDDLSEEIEKALYHSKYLIAICSPEYLESVWCMKEIDTFLKYKDRKHILLVLSKGEPETAFPDVLLYDEVFEEDSEGKEFLVKKPREPLAADCRAENPKERKEAVDRAVIRLMAAIAGVGYDDLKQRHRKEVNAKRTRRTLTAFAILGAVFALSLFFLVKIANQNAVIKQRYADSLATTSGNLLLEGRRIDAVYAARLGLPDKETKTYSDLASKALVKALGIYDTPDVLAADRDLIVPCSIAFMDISYGGKYMGIRGLDLIRYILDAGTGDLLYTFEDENFSNFVFDGERGFAFRREGQNFCYYNLATCTETDLGISDGALQNNERGNGYAIVGEKQTDFYDGADKRCSLVYEDYIPYLVEKQFDVFIDYSPDGRMAYLFLLDYEGTWTYGFETDLQTGSVRTIELNGQGLLYDITTDGTTIVWHGSESGQTTVCAQSVSGPADFRKLTLTVDAFGVYVDGNDIVLRGEPKSYHLSRDLQILNEMTIDDYVSVVHVSNDGILLMEGNGNIHKIKDGDYTVLSVSGSVGDRNYDRIYCDGVLFQAVTGDNHVATYTNRKSDYLTPYDGEFNPVKYWEYDDPEIQAFRQLVIQKEPGLDQSRILDVILCENADLGIMQFWDGAMSIYNRTTGEKLKTVYSINGRVNTFVYDKAKDLYYVNAADVEVFNRDFRNIYNIPNCYFLGISKETGNPVVGRWEGGSERQYQVRIVSYDEMIRLSDEMLVGYEPDERVKEKYSLE